jgi:uncharacterized protein (TIGR03435 family)
MRNNIGEPSVTALAQEQTGLKLEARKERIEVLVIDRAAKASVN